MNELIKNLENLRDTNTRITKADKDRYSQIESELNLVIKHSADRVTLEKDFLKDFLRISTALYFEAGFTNCIDILKQQAPADAEAGEQ